MNVLSHYFELSKVDAEHAISIYKTFAKQTDQVVQYLSVARQYEHVTKLEIPKIKHAPTSLAASLQEYIDDNDFEVNRRQYLAEQQAKGGPNRVGKFTTTNKSSQADSKPAQAASHVEAVATQPATKAPAPDLMDFFGSIEPAQAPQPPAQQYAQPAAQPFQQEAFPQMYGQSPPNGAMPGQSTNPFGQVQNDAFQQPQQIQPNFTGAGFGGYSAQPQQMQTQQTGFPASNPYQTDTQQFSPQASQPFGIQQQQPQQQIPQIQQPLQQQQQMQPPSTNPFRQSMMLTGQMTGFGAAASPPQQQQQQSTNPFARSSQSPAQSANGTPFANQQQQQQQPMQTGGFSTPPQLQPQPTGTNPFARQTAPAPQQPQQTGASPAFLTPAVTGSTNPFRQSAFVNQQTGTGWQNASQGTIGGWEQLDTLPVFPRPGQA